MQKVFASGFLQLKDMVGKHLYSIYIKKRFNYKNYFLLKKLKKKKIISGLILKLIGLALLFLASNTWLLGIFVDDSPGFINGTNVTAMAHAFKMNMTSVF